MKNKIKAMILFILLITIIPISTFASTLTLKVKTDKSQYEVGDTVIATVNWAEKMQAASFVIEYDSDVLEFKSSSVENTYYSTDTKGEILVNWFAMNDIELTNIKFEFKTLKIGNTNISIKNVDGFADSNMVTPTEYEYTSIGKVNIVANSNNSSNEENKQNDNSNNSNQNNNGNNSNQNNKENTGKETKKIEEAKKAYSTKEEESKINTKLPKTGVSTFFIPIVIISTIGIIGYIKYKKLSGI